jgi:hypothetical protein
LSLNIPKNKSISPIKLLVVGKLIFAKIKMNKKIEYSGNKKATPP